jgi:hypothetical protein
MILQEDGRKNKEKDDLSKNQQKRWSKGSTIFFIPILRKDHSGTFT